MTVVHQPRRRRRPFGRTLAAGRVVAIAAVVLLSARTVEHLAHFDLIPTAGQAAVWRDSYHTWNGTVLVVWCGLLLYPTLALLLPRRRHVRRAAVRPPAGLGAVAPVAVFRPGRAAVVRPPLLGVAGGRATATTLVDFGVSVPAVLRRGRDGVVQARPRHARRLAVAGLGHHMGTAPR